jgi:hypothetical protein
MKRISANIRRHIPFLLLQGCVLTLAACATQDPGSANTAPATTTVASAPAAPTAPAAPPAPITALPHDEAVLLAARDLFAKAQLPAGQKYSIVIDPLVDGVTGMQSVATAAMEKQVVGLVRSGFPQFEIKPFSASTVADLPLILIGTFTPINLQGKADGERDAYRVCFALADLKTGKIVSKGFARSLTGGVDPSPTPYFRDAPLWVSDKIVEGYIKTCQGTKAGDPINPAYIDKIVAATTIDEAMRAYNSKNYKDALALYNAVLRNPAGDQPRVHSGIYLANLKMGRRDAAMKSFGKVVQYGLTGNRLAVNFNFRPAGTGFAVDGNPYEQWLKEIARQSAQQTACVEVAGHASRGGSEPMNERISLQRAEYVKQRLVAEQKNLAKRLTSQGYGSRQSMIGTGSGDASDALDRRIEFKTASC